MGQPQIEMDEKITSGQETLYDASPYESYSYYKTHPDYLYLLGRLHGLTPPDYRTARVLELGCAGGGNLAPFASLYPQSDCHGIDVSGEEIRQANLLKEKLGLKNITFAKRDILEITEKTDGKFDYIICHGLLAWVPAPVGEKIFEICARQLTEHGMAIISYNALPGWNAIRSIRDMMLYEVRNCGDIKLKVKKARNLLSFLARNVPPESVAYSHILRAEDAVLSTTFEDFILHDHLGENNDPLYLYQFNEELESRGLQYVCDSELSNQYEGALSEEARNKIGSIKSRIERLQKMDFILNRRFHSSVITRSDKKISDKFDKNFIFECCLTLNASPEGEDPDPSKPLKYKKKQNGEATITIENKYLNEILLEMFYMGMHPLKMDDIIERIMQSTEIDNPAPFRQAALDLGLDLIRAGYFHIYAEPAYTVNYLSDKPCSHPLIRAFAESHPSARKIIHPYRGMIEADNLVKWIILHCDGTRTEEDLNKELMDHVEKKDFRLNDRNGLPLTDPVQQQLLLKTTVFKVLNDLAGGGVFVS